jgi:CRP-like cAMP-binding protein
MDRTNGGRPRWLTAATSPRRARDLDRLRALRSTRELSHCSDSELRSLLPHADEIAVRSGSRLAVEGQPCREFLIVIEGRLRAASSGGGCQTLGSGDSWGWSAMWERSLNDATVVADSDARLLVMGHAQFRAVKALAAPPEVTAHVCSADQSPKPTLAAGWISAFGQGPRFTARGG